MTQQIVYPTRREIERHAECIPSPYDRGFEDGRYPRAGGRVGTATPTATTMTHGAPTMPGSLTHARRQRRNASKKRPDSVREHQSGHTT